ncbi:MJ0042-type zinc finger domain-containing protein [Nostoc sp. ChiSLP03a]
MNTSCKNCHTSFDISESWRFSIA